MTDWELIQAYAQRRSEEAFAQLVARYVDLVYSSAVRQVQSADLAQDVAQAVFLLLAQKAAEFRPGTVLAGWLFRSTRFIAARAMRAERRRQWREVESARMNPPIPQTDSDALSWDQVAPLLDQAIAALPETDRQAVLLRYMARKPFREVGQELGLEEEATKKRVSRAVEKLRVFFRKKGVVLTTVALTAGLGERSVQAAPSTLNAQIAAALHAGASSLNTVADLVEAAQRSIFRAKLRLAVGWGLVAVILLTLSLRLMPSATRKAGPGDVRMASLAERSPAARQRAATPASRSTRQTIRFSLTVLAAEDATPLAGARLLVDWWNGNQSAKLPVLQTDARGVVEFNVPRLPFEFMHLWVSADGRVPKIIDWHRYELAEDATSYTVKLTQGSALSGLVQDQSGQRVAGATVSFSGPGANLAEREYPHFHPELSAVTSDEFGRWNMNQMPAAEELTIRASHPDFATTEIGTWAAPGRPTNIVLVLTNGFPVYGQVLNAGGQPVPGATICKESGASRCATADVEGRFYWARVEPGKVWVNVRADGFEELNESFQVTNGLTEVVFRLADGPGWSVPGPGQRETVRLAGSVIDADTRQAIPHFKVLQGDILPSAGTFRRVLLDNGQFVGEGHNGQFDWELNQSQLRGAVQIEAEGYLPALLAMSSPLEFKLHRSQIVEGLVQTPEGAPADGATVSLSGMGFGCTMQKEGQLLRPNLPFFSTRTQSDREGHFRLQSMTGTEGLVAVHRAGSAFLPMPLASNLVVTLEPWGAIEGVLYLGGRRAPRESVWVNGIQEFPVKSRFALSFTYRTQTDQDGHFRFDCVPAGDHLVSRLVNSIDSHTVLAAVRPGQTATVELRGQGRMVIGRIALAEPAAEVSRGMSQAFLLLQGSTPPQPRDFADPGEHWRAVRLYNAQTKFPFGFQQDGTIRADDVPPGSYTLKIELRAATPDSINMEKSLGAIERKVTIPPGDAPLDLGKLEVR